MAFRTFPKSRVIALLIALHLGFDAQAGFGFDTTNSCDSYAALASEMHCGPNSYIPQFGLPYCEKYLSHASSFSAAAQKVLAKIRSCLQEQLLAQGEALNCDNIQEMGVNSHYSCYVDSGFCSLTEQDISSVMWIAKSEMFNGPVIAVFFDVLHSCNHQ